MPKWVGGIFGNTVSSTAIGDAIRGVFSIQNQYYMKQEGGWVFPTYSVSPSTSSVNEGSSVTFTTTTTNVPNGTTLYWTLNTVSGTVNASDFSGGATSGSFSVTGNSGSVVLTLANDLTTEGSESFQLQVRTGSTEGPIVATSSTVTINDTSTSQISATGGTVIDSGGFRIHVFTSPGSFVVSAAPPVSNTVEYLVVAGGGAGGPGNPASSGGGGAGGLRTATGFPITATTYPITVGGGGSPSIFSSITSAAGGSGGAYGATGAAGGSGGGGGGTGGGETTSGGAGNTPSTSPSQGNPGAGRSPGNNFYLGGGGGGAGSGATPNPASTDVLSPGGIGLPISWLPASYGTPGPAPGRYFAGGGGGGAGPRLSPAPSFAPGGAGGGGQGGQNATPGSPGTTNTGGGGGGAGFPSNAGSGGSGIIAIRYPYT